MDDSIQIFKNPQFGEIRTAMSANGEPLFCLADVCNALGINGGTRNVKSRLSEKGVVSINTLTNGGNQQLNFITEPNLYKCIFQSRKKEAEAFQEWVCNEVLPSIRKHGIYATPQTIEDMIANPDNAIRLLQTVKQERERRLLAEATIKQNESKVNFANAMLASQTSCLVGELAKVLTQNGYTIGQNRLFEWLRENGYLGIHGERRNIPNQEYIERGYFELKKGVRSGGDGTLHTVTTTKITPKGQEHLIEKLLKPYRDEQEHI